LYTEKPSIISLVVLVPELPPDGVLGSVLLTYHSLGFDIPMLSCMILAYFSELWLFFKALNDLPVVLLKC